MKKKFLLFSLLFLIIFIPKIYAACDEESYKVTYNANGGIGASDPTCVFDTLSTIKPTRSGYKFLGWSTNKKATTIEYTAGGEIHLETDTTLYAVWSKGYKITYNPKGGTISTTTKTVYPGFTYGTLTTPKRKGYTFEGWYTEDGKLITKTTDVTLKTTHTLYAKWKKIKYTITYELKYGTNNKNNKTSYYVTTGTFALLNPTKKGYKFVGWYKESTYKTKVTSIKKGTTGNKTFYAKWTPIKYSVSFWGNGSTSGSMTNQTGLKYDKTYTLITNKFKKNDYVFDSWNTKLDGTGKSYENEGSVKKVVKLYAQWKRKEYKITYVLNGGTNPDNAYNYYSKVSSFTLKEPTREGYVFEGWYTESDFINRVERIEKGTTGNKTFYAKWRFDAYTITYVLNGGTNPSDAVTSYKANEEKELPQPSRTGYTFKGWYKESSFVNRVERIESGMTGNLTLYAKWESKTYSIIYELNGGTNPENAINSYNYNEEKELPVPTRKGYSFKGWYKESDFVNKVERIEKGMSGNLTLYAKWTKASYTITYNLNGGTNPEDAPTTYTISDEVTLPIPSRADYLFLGWYTEETFENEVLKIEKGSTGNKSFYAQWDSFLTYTITYELNGGSNPTGTQTTYNIENTITLPTPTRRGYTFEGWYESEIFTGNAITTIAVGTTGDKTYYAKWIVNTYTITYSLDDGVNPSNVPTTYTVEDSITLPTPTKEGYTFNGWYTNDEFTGNAITTIALGTIGNKTYYAKWTIKSYTITYMLNGGTNPTGTQTSYTIEDAVTLSTPTKKGNTFNGWYATSDFSGNVETSIPQGSTGNKTYYASWTVNSYTITYNLDGGTNPSDAPETYTVEDAITLPTPTKAGYTFNGWYTNSSCSGSAVTSISAGTTGNKTYYAKWTFATYTITYELDGGYNPNTAPTSYNNYESITLPTPFKSGYTFVGWYTSSSFSGNPVTTIEIGTTGNKTYYAKWIENVLEIDYDYIFFTNEYDNQLTSQDDIKNTIYNVLNQGLSSVTLYCSNDAYSTSTACFNDFTAVFQNNDIMKSISDYVHPYNSYSNIRTSRTTSGSTWKITMSIYYKYSDEDQTAIDNMLDSIIVNNNIGSMSEANKIKTFHDYIVNNTVYDMDAAEDPTNAAYAASFSAYGLLINGLAVCQGYADAMAIFLDRYQIPNIRVSSTSHTWNLIYTNGSWQHLDATWDDPVTSNGSNIISWAYYLVTTTQLQNLDPSGTHTFVTGNYLEAN